LVSGEAVAVERIAFSQSNDILRWLVTVVQNTLRAEPVGF
jgi:hypothetical protein